ncbi:MAG: exonuclease domain-containing protein [Bacteroidota bacterium]
MFAVVDIETTGGGASYHKITEIAILIHDGKRVVRTFETLINPERYISPHITMLTGISNEMVRDAPKFYEVAKEIFLLLQDKIFVAHNVNFDYSFIREEFKSLGGDFSLRKLCTVRLSRKLFPGFPSYSLGNLCGSLGIPLKNRHRAMGDAAATAELFSRLIEKDEEGEVLKMGRKIFSESNIPANLSSEVFQSLPSSTGVYYFHDSKGKVIYVGKANDIKKRIQQHFTISSEHRLDFLEKIHNITFQLTGTELIALLLESHEIKKLWPFYNRRQKTLRGSHALVEYYDGQGIHRLGLSRQKNGSTSLTSFQNFTEARGFLQRLCDEFQLCPKCSGLQVSDNVCFDFKLHKCKGVCAGLESVENYNERVAQALESYLGKLETHIITGEGRSDEEKSVVLVDRGEYKGFGYFPVSFDLRATENCYEVISSYQDNPDVRKILRWYLNSEKLKVNALAT